MNTGPSIRPGRPATLLCLALLWAGGTLAQQPQEPDPPEQVARLSFLEGEVLVVAAGQGDSIAAVLNRPLTNGDELRVGRDSRAELQLGDATLHLDAGSRLSILDLDDQVTRLRLTEGTLVANVREAEGAGDRQPVELETPNARVALLEPGEYRISVEDGGVATVVGVREGASEISSGSEVFSLADAQEGRYTGLTGLEEEVHQVDRRDRFESWADERVADDERSESSSYVSRELIGYRDLDRYGYWESDPYHGYVWSPRHLSYGWAPYRFGHWSWIGPWGWTWIDDAPWGFAPFHYGRWAFLSSRWCWVPGPRHVRPIYAPALVGWRGSGSNVGWFPLGPREAYVPRHHASDRYLRRINPPDFVGGDKQRITHRRHDSDPVRRYSNERNSAAVTTMPRQAFTSGRPVSRNLVRLDERDLRPAPSKQIAPPAPVMRDQRSNVVRTVPRSTTTPYRPATPNPGRQEPARRYEIPSQQRSESYPAPGARPQARPEPRYEPRTQSRPEPRPSSSNSTSSRNDPAPSTRHDPRDRDRGNRR